MFCGTVTTLLVRYRSTKWIEWLLRVTKIFSLFSWTLLPIPVVRIIVWLGINETKWLAGQDL
jgi:hypothetical protein